MDAVTTNARQLEDGGEGLSFDMPVARWQRLFASIGKGRRESLADLYDATSDRLYGLALWSTRSPEDAADVVSAVFVKLAEHRASLPSIRDPRAWLLTVTRRLTIDLARRKRRWRTESLETVELLAAPAGDPVRRVDARLAGALLALLPAHQREVIYLRHYADCTFAAIGRITGVPTFTAASRYRLGIRRLRRLMEDRS